ncbi:MAG: glycerol-3-phosphate 1-O-acyltransferase PlsY [Gammaproteobacteria bacterium]|nr:glycerol-3-phosphate 1-O-acyltransferase PlsY [Gammaproteobacteria bacterium]MBU1645828.1 glycerol-3-phosphate 1-O-acyltransferase PlsY [Gammaproteobacteria bacterium]MBU1971890.1 glycerol-3-phosphate 1-O-acyltransferase PlsY [Gammaproteobacteria bacterium]
MNPLVFALLGYLLGSLPFAVIVSKAFGLADPRSFGSGNPGATNVLRTGNKLAAGLTLLGDAAKGWLAMVLAGLLGADATGAAVAGVAAFLGHVFPLFLRFKGGKGVATALGVLIGIDGMLAALVAATWLGVAVISRYSSLAAVAAACVAPTLALEKFGIGAVSSAVIFMCALLLWRHRSNIANLAAGTEGGIGGGKKA